MYAVRGSRRAESEAQNQGKQKGQRLKSEHAERELRQWKPRLTGQLESYSGTSPTNGRFGSQELQGSALSMTKIHRGNKEKLCAPVAL